MVRYEGVVSWKSLIIVHPTWFRRLFFFLFTLELATFFVSHFGFLAYELTLLTNFDF